MGLGLAIIKSIMVLHGGTITVESVLHQGTTISLRFPLPSEVSR
jgi:two-component system heavy metal sensor histidine kinase CusS